MQFRSSYRSKTAVLLLITAALALCGFNSLPVVFVGCPSVRHEFSWRTSVKIRRRNERITSIFYKAGLTKGAANAITNLLPLAQQYYDDNDRYVMRLSSSLEEVLGEVQILRSINGDIQELLQRADVATHLYDTVVSAYEITVLSKAVLLQEEGKLPTDSEWHPTTCSDKILDNFNEAERVIIADRKQSANELQFMRGELAAVLSTLKRLRQLSEEPGYKKVACEIMTLADAALAEAKSLDRDAQHMK